VINMVRLCDVEQCSMTCPLFYCADLLILIREFKVYNSWNWIYGFFVDLEISLNWKFQNNCSSHDSWWYWTSRMKAKWYEVSYKAPAEWKQIPPLIMILNFFELSFGTFYLYFICINARMIHEEEIKWEPFVWD